MRSIIINLNTIDKVKSFVAMVSKFSCEMTITSGRYMVDAKSIMGIFSLDLTNELSLHVPADDYDEVKKVMKDFIAE